MSNYGTLISQVLEDLARDDITAQASSAIQSAIRYYDGRRFWFNEGRATRSTSADTEWYSLPTDLKDIDTLVITINNWTYPLKQRSHSDLEDTFVSSANYTGYPTDFALYQEQLRLYPIPNGTYTMTISYQKKLSSLVSDSDTNAWTDEARELIRHRAASIVAVNYLHDPQLGSFFTGYERDVLRRLDSETTMRLTTGHTRKRRI